MVNSLLIEDVRGLTGARAAEAMLEATKNCGIRTFIGMPKREQISTLFRVPLRVTGQFFLNDNVFLSQ